MPFETVDILVQSDEVVPTPLNDVVVRVYDATGTTLLVQGTTGVLSPAGHLDLTLPVDAPPAPTRYSLRFYAQGVAIGSPQAIDVYSPASLAPTATNEFQVSGTLLTVPTSPDPLLSRLSGYVRTPSGRPKRGLDISFISEFSPLVASGTGVLGERVDVRTDENGYVEVDLFRSACYRATVESMEECQRIIAVPDRASANINYVLFPIVELIEYDPEGPFAMDVNDVLVLTPSVTATNHQLLIGIAHEDVEYTSSDPTILTVTQDAGNETITLRAIAPGTANLIVTRLDNSIVYVPPLAIENGSVAVTVT